MKSELDHPRVLVVIRCIPQKYTWVVQFRQIKSELDHPRILVGNTFPPDDSSPDKILLFAVVAVAIVIKIRNIRGVGSLGAMGHPRLQNFAEKIIFFEIRCVPPHSDFNGDVRR